MQGCRVKIPEVEEEEQEKEEVEEKEENEREATGLILENGM